MARRLAPGGQRQLGFWSASADLVRDGAL